MTAIALNAQYINLKTGDTVEVTEVDGHRVGVVTVTTTGARINPRSLPAATLKATPYNNRGDFLSTGLVAISSLPAEHPLKANRTTEPSLDSGLASVEASFNDPSLMGDEELFSYANSCKARMELSKSVYERARDELASRTPDAGGVRIQGSIAVEATPTRRISDALARRVLDEEDLKMVSVSKVESGLVKKLLGVDVYDTICENHGWTIKVREATERDYESVRSGKF